MENSGKEVCVLDGNGDRLENMVAGSENNKRVGVDLSETSFERIYNRMNLCSLHRVIVPKKGVNGRALLAALFTVMENLHDFHLFVNDVNYILKYRDVRSCFMLDVMRRRISNMEEGKIDLRGDWYSFFIGKSFISNIKKSFILKETGEYIKRYLDICGISREIRFLLGKADAVIEEEGNACKSFPADSGKDREKSLVQSGGNAEEKKDSLFDDVYSMLRLSTMHRAVHLYAEDMNDGIARIIALFTVMEAMRNLQPFVYQTDYARKYGERGGDAAVMNMELSLERMKNGEVFLEPYWHEYFFGKGIFKRFGTAAILKSAGGYVKNIIEFPTNMKRILEELIDGYYTVLGEEKIFEKEEDGMQESGVNRMKWLK